MVQYFSRAGLERLREELKYRREVLRPEISKKIQEAKSLGDISENAEYDEAIAMRSFNEGRIVELEQILKSAITIESETGHEHPFIEVGASVKVESKNGVQTFTIVGSSEADPSKGFISNESPLGSAFLGHAKGDEVEAETPKGKIKYHILEIL